MRIFLFLIFMMGCSAFAQVAEKTITLHFATSSSQIVPQEEQKLEEVISLYQKSGFFSVELNAHTDKQGNRHFNQRLSFDRRKAVENLLISKGILPQHIQSFHFGEDKPLLQEGETEDVPENRRVELIIRYHQFQKPDDIFNYTNQNNITRVSFSEEGGQMVTGNSGTQLIIPNDAFQTSDGRLVSNKGVVFELEEYNGLGQGISNKLTTIADGRILESGGMFRMQAFLEGEELQLREGKEISVQMPSNNIQSGMSVFVGERDENGNVIWEQTDGKFIPVDTSAPVKLPLQGFKEKLVINQVELPPSVDYTDITVGLSIPKCPRKPHPPRMPSLPLNPNENRNYTVSFMKFLSPRYYRHQRKVREYESRLKKYDKRMERYNRALKLYEARQKEYERNYTQYVEDSIQFVSHIQDLIACREADFSSIKSHYDAFRYNRALHFIGKKMDDSLFFSTYLLDELQVRSQVQVQNADYFKMMKLYRDIEFLKFLISENGWTHPDWVQRNGKVDITMYQNSLNNGRIKGDGINAQLNQCRNYIRQNLLANSHLYDTTQNAELVKMQEEVRERKIEAGIFDRRDLHNMYTASVKNMGFINCDRFSEIPPRRMAKLEIEKPIDAIAYVLVPRLNSLIPLNSFSPQNLQLPIGEKVTVMVIGVHNGKPTYSEENWVIKKGANKLIMNPINVDLDFLKTQLSRL